MLANARVVSLAGFLAVLAAMHEETRILEIDRAVALHERVHFDVPVDAPR